MTDVVRQAREYLDLMGHPPPVDTTDLAWQWDYRGTPAERKLLRLELGLEQETDEPASQDEQLF